MKSWTECIVESLLPGNVIVFNATTKTVKDFPRLDKKAGRVYIVFKEGGSSGYDEGEEVEVYR